MMVFAKINFAKMASLHYMNIISGEIKSVFPAKNLREAFKKKSLTFVKPAGRSEGVLSPTNQQKKRFLK